MDNKRAKEILNAIYGCCVTCNKRVYTDTDSVRVDCEPSSSLSGFYTTTFGGTHYDMNMNAVMTYMVGPHTSSNGRIYRRKVWRGGEMLERKHICEPSECWEIVEDVYIDMTSNPPVVYEDEEEFKKFLKERGIIKY